MYVVEASGTSKGIDGATDYEYDPKEFHTRESALVWVNAMCLGIDAGEGYQCHATWLDIDTLDVVVYRRNEIDPEPWRSELHVQMSKKKQTCPCR